MTILETDRHAGDTAGEPHAAGDWVAVCPLTDLTPGRGVAALLDGEQVAVFLLGYPDGSADLRAVGNIDPFARAAVISRGLVGARGPVPTVASPLLKQVFSLDTGECLDDSSHARPVYPIRVRAGVVEVTRWADAA